VRASRHDARVTTLLEMFLAANPSKGKTDEEKEEIKKKYSPGDDVLPKVEAREKTLRERRAEDADQRLLNEVRDLSLREVGVETPEARRERRRRDDSRLRTSRPHSSRDTSRDGRSGDERERRRRREADSERRRARDDTALRPETESTEERRRRRSNEEGRRRHEETSRTAARQINHQSSLRSLISSSDVDSHEMEEEILRQIREEGLLDGIDLENIDVSQEDQISERIAEAFRRRQDEKARQERDSRRDESSRRRAERASASGSREVSTDRSSGRRRTHSRTPSAVSVVSTVSALSQGDEPSRPPPSMSAAQSAHLDVQSSDEGRRRRRTTSGNRSSTAPIPVAPAEARPAARSQTDLSDRPQSLNLSSARPSVTSSSRSTTDPTTQRPSELPAEQGSRGSPRAPSSPRMRTFSRSEDLSGPTATSESRTRAAPPAEIFVPSSAPSAISKTSGDRAMAPAPLSPRHAAHNSLSDRANAITSGTRPTSSSSIGSRPRPHLYPEPSLTCARCSKPHIEYDLHYNCAICHSGNFNICLSCYRSGAGCLHWFGFGYAAWSKWDRLIQSRELPPDAERPHMLTANRYVPPRIAPGGADGRRTLTTDDPQKRLQSGAFCANCLAWANECYWRCDFCNEADWGFCNLCVNQGRSCTHALLPLTFRPSESEPVPLTPTHDQQMPPSATILTGPGVMDIGRFKPLTFSTKCDICHYPIQPSSTRYHCFSCTSKVPNTHPGDYDICTTCYPKLVASRRISAENGHSGWRRCLQGHRMVIVGFEDNRGGQRRVIVQDLVGGRGLHEEPFDSPDHSDLQQWSWTWADGTRNKLVTSDVMKTAPTSAPGVVIASGFPPDGGSGMTCVALWSWYPAEGANDELLFPKGAELREVTDVNTDWFHGTYMGKRGLFPAPYARILDKGPSS